MQITFESVSLTDASCFGYDDGSITITASGGTGTYEYSSDNGTTYQTSPDVITLLAGDYTLMVKDDNDCESTDSLVTIGQPEGIDITSEEVQDITCGGYNDGVITIVGSGGAGSLLYSINDGADYFDNNGLFSDLAGGDYNVRVRDADNCEVSGSILTVAEPDTVKIISEESQDITCSGDNNGMITIVASGGTGTILYSINNGTDYLDNNGSFTDLTEGDYNARVIDANDCEASGSLITITEPDALSIVSEDYLDINCNGDNNGAITIIASGGAGDILYSINNGTDYFDNNGLFTGLMQGNYNVRIIDGNDCEVSGNMLTITEPGALIIDTTDVVHISDIQTGSIILDFSGGTEPITYILVPEATDSLTNNTGQFNDLAVGNYIVYALDNNSCKSNSINVQIVILGENVLIIYDAFSPNADGKNDVWNIGNIRSYPNCVVKIFNTWGTTVFNSDGYTEPWDGTHNGKELPSGTYFYFIDLGNGNETYTGTVNIVK